MELTRTFSLYPRWTSSLCPRHSRAAIGQGLQLLCSSYVAFYSEEHERYMVASTRRRRPEIFSV